MPFLERNRDALAASPPFDFAKSLDYLRRFPPPALDQAVAEDSFIKAFRLDGQTLAASVSGAVVSGMPGLQYTLYANGKVSADLERDFQERLRSFLSLDDDLRPFYDLAVKDPQFAPVVQELYGYHPVRFASPFEAAVWAILSQRNRMTTARNMYRSLARRFGHAAELDGVTCWAFPEPQDIAGCSEGDVAFAARNLRRGEFLIDAARAFALVPPDFLSTAEHAEVEAWLLGINGIGPWSAGFILLRGLGRAATVPLLDRVILEAASRLYGGGITLDVSEVRRIAQRYHPWEGYWAHYIRIGA